MGEARSAGFASAARHPREPAARALIHVLAMRLADRIASSTVPTVRRHDRRSTWNGRTGRSRAQRLRLPLGSWRVRNRCLRERFAGSGDWEEFEATSIVRPLVGGLGNEDEFRTAPGLRGHVAAAFRPALGRWAIYWADSRRPGLLDPPVLGGFDGDVGTFEGHDTLGRPAIVMRFLWTGRAHPDPALGAGLLRRRRTHLGAELGERFTRA